MNDNLIEWPYYGYFKNWNDVKGEFITNEPEPEEVLIAHYDVECYEGTAHVLFRNGDKYFYVEGNHCSCYGLEKQFEPEEYDLETLIKVFEKGDLKSTFPEAFRKLIARQAHLA